MNVLAPYYPSGGGPGRPPVSLERILRMYVAQQCFGLSDEGTKDAVYDSHAIRRFVGIDLNREAAPDATTLLKFRHLLEEHHLTESSSMRLTPIWLIEDYFFARARLLMRSQGLFTL